MEVRYKVNLTSLEEFDGGSTAALRWAESPGPVEFVRSVSFAINHWAAYGGSRWVGKFVGSTTATSGSAGDYLIVAKPGCANPSTCVPVAENDTYLRSITLFGALPPQGPGIRQFTMLPKLANSGSIIDFTRTIVHEWGHSVLSGQGVDGGHVVTASGNDWCVMAELQNGEGLSGLCDVELRNIGRSENNLVGSGYLNTLMVQSSATGLVSNWSTPTNTALTSGIGGGVLFYAPDVFAPTTEWRLIGRTASTLSNASSIPPVTLAPPDNSWSANVISNTQTRPSVVYDPVRKAWWTIVRISGSSGNENRLKLFKSIPGVGGAWQDFGFLSHMSTLAQSRYPVGLSFDPRSSNLVVTWNSSEGLPYGLVDGSQGGNNSSSLSSGAGCDAPNPSFAGWLRHCRGEILAGIIVPEGTGTGHLLASVQRFNPSPASYWGYTGLGTPTVVCDPGSSYPAMQCEVAVVNTSQWKEIVNWRLCVSGSGFCGYSLRYAERNSPGETDFPIAASARRVDGSGRITQAVVGTDLNIWWRSKPSVGAGFPGWFGPLGPHAAGGPSVIRSEIADVYTLIFPKVAP